MFFPFFIVNTPGIVRGSYHFVTIESNTDPTLSLTVQTSRCIVGNRDWRFPSRQFGQGIPSAVQARLAGRTQAANQK
jgi:hypothetical protein